MTEDRRKIIEKLYIDNYAYPMEQFALMEYHKEQRKAKSHALLKNPLGKVKCMGVHTPWRIKSYLILNVAHAQCKLDDARKEAHEIFEKYMIAKNNLNTELFNYSDPVIRKEFNKIKQAWIDASNKVKDCKCCLYSASLQYTRWNEWYQATNDHIRQLEKTMSEWHKNPEDLPLAIDWYSEEPMRWYLLRLKYVEYSGACDLIICSRVIKDGKEGWVKSDDDDLLDLEGNEILEWKAL